MSLTVKSKAAVYGFLGAAGLALLALLHIMDRRWALASVPLNEAAVTALAWVCFYSLWRTAAGEAGAARRAWGVFAAGLAFFALSDTALFYVTVVRDKTLKGLWGLNTINVVGFGFIVAGLMIKARSFGRSLVTAQYVVLVAVILGAFAAALWPIYAAVSASSRIPAVAVALAVGIPLFDLVVLSLSSYVALAYGRGLAGRPWVAVALGICFYAAADILGMYAGWNQSLSYTVSQISGLASFAMYGSILWGSWYHRNIVREALV